MSQNFIPLSVPNLKGKELEYVTQAIQTEWVSTVGSFVTQFEEDLASYVGAKGAVSCQSGTAGLHLALLLCGVERDDLVFAPTLTFIAAVNPIAYVGAEPIFMDCDASLCLDPVKLRRYCLEECDVQDEKLIDRSTGKHIKAVVMVHVFGNMGNMEMLLQVAEEFHLKVIEDATEALGSYYQSGALAGKFAGTMGDVGVYSFNGNKIITTGGGGMLVSQDESLLQRGKHLSTQAKSDPLYYTHDEIGFNYRMTNVQAALGVAQLEQLEDFIAVKSRNYAQYHLGLSEIEGLDLLAFSPSVRSNHWFYALDCGNFGKTRDEVLVYLDKKNIQTRPIWGLISQQLPYQHCRAYDIMEAYGFYDNVINLPCSSNLTEEEVSRVLKSLALI